MPPAADTLIARLQADGTAAGERARAFARRKLREVEAGVKGDPLVLSRGRFLDCASRHLRIDEVAR
jgi:hypothetical protein